MSLLNTKSKINSCVSRNKHFAFFYKTALIFVFVCTIIPLLNAQQTLGNIKDIVDPFVNTNLKGIENKNLEIKVSNQEVFKVSIESNKCEEDKYYLFGKVERKENATFFLRGNKDAIEGKIIDYKNKRAFVIYTNELKEVLVNEVDIHSQVCIYEEQHVSNVKTEDVPLKFVSNNSIPQLESFPGAPGVVYLDFDGEKVSGGAWGDIDAAPSGASDEFIEEAFYVTAENYAPFNINVTTIRSIYDNSNKNSRQMIIYNTTYPSNPGVAMLNSFNDGSGDPCWVKMGGPVSHGTKGGNVGTHEVGHTLGLKHDGSPAGEYYKGHDVYRVIMGTVSDGFSQWSKGEYKDANNNENDLEIISGNKNKVGYREDDHGNDISSSTKLIVESNGEVKEDENFGLIEKTTDVDLFKMELTSGTLNLTVRPADKYDFSQSLDVKIRLLDANGDEITSADGNSFEASTINEEISVEGSDFFYLEIDGIGKGDPLVNGYTDYGSIGQFFISGKAPIKATGIEDINLSNAVKIFPIPANEKINIKHDFNKVNYKIFSLHGAIVSEGIIGNNKSNNQIDVSSFKSGIYSLKITTNEGQFVRKIIIE